MSGRRSCSRAKGPGTSAGAFPMELSLSGEGPRGPRRGPPISFSLSRASRSPRRRPSRARSSRSQRSRGTSASHSALGARARWPCLGPREFRPPARGSLAARRPAAGARGTRLARRGPRVRSHCRSTDSGTEYVREFGIKWVSGSKKATMRPSPTRTSMCESMPHPFARPHLSEEGVRLAQKMQVGPRIPV